jgi:hypothetical protein
VALIGAAAAVTGCGGDGPDSSQERIERVERRYEQLWDAESVSCREAPGKEGYECRIISGRQPSPAPDGR